MRTKRALGMLAKLCLLCLFALLPTDAAGTQPVSVRMAAPAAAVELLTPEAPPAPAEIPADPAPEPEPEPLRPPEPPEGPVEADYFADAVFLGNSRTEGLSLYSGLDTPVYLHSVGASVYSVLYHKTEKAEEGKITLMDRLDQLEFAKLYIMLGVNELGWAETEKYERYYGEILERVRENHPDARIALQSILPVSRRQEAKKTYVNNSRIDEYNAVVEKLAEEWGCTYLDVAAAVEDEEGFLPSEFTGDGVHMNIRGSKAWLEFLLNNPI